MRKAILIILTALLCGCAKYEADEFTGYTLPRITGYNTGVTNDWLYFCLEDGTFMNLESPNSDLPEGFQYYNIKWDFAICGCKMRTNSGTSGRGKGGAADLGYVDYDKYQSVADLPQDLKWAVDDSTIEVTFSKNDWNRYLMANNMDFDANPWFNPNSGPAMSKASGNPILSQAVVYAGPPPTYEPSYHTYIIRTADGKNYYKFQVVSWFNDNTEIGGDGGMISYYLDKLK